MRHAKSSWKDLSLADHDRPLNKRGKRTAPAMADLLRRKKCFPDFVLGSTAERVLKTAELLLKEKEVPASFVRELYHAEPEAIFDALKTLPDDAKLPMIIGHNPGLEEFLEQWTGAVRMPTGAICVLRVQSDSWSKAGPSTKAEVLEVWRPKEQGIT